MKDVTLKITSFLFIVLWSIPLLVVLSFNIKQHAIRYKMNQRMQHLQKIKLPENEVVWMDDDEIWHNELMFDIRSSNLREGIYTFEGFYDGEETELVKQRNKTTEKNNEQNNEEQNLISQLFKWLESSYSHQENNFDLTDGDLTKYNLFKSSSLIFLAQKVPTPPPRQLRTYHLA